MTKAIYAFSGDPITLGHVNIVQRAATIFDELIVAIGANPDKQYLFSLKERTDMAQRSLQQFPNVTVTSFQGMLVDFAYEQNVDVIVKGVRSNTDFIYEKSLDQLGDSQKLGMDTVFLFADPQLEHVSSSAAKAIQKEQGLIHEFVPLYVKEKLEAKISGQYIVGVTGEIGAGKTHLCTEFVAWGEQHGIPVHNIELDVIGHDILEKLEQPKYLQIRKTIVETFGDEVLQDPSKDTFVISRKVLGEVVFSDISKLAKLNEILYLPLLVRIRRELYGKKGVILLNAALIAESEMSYLCNNNCVLVEVSEKEQKERLKKRDLSDEQIDTRIQSQYTTEKKQEIISNCIQQSAQGKIWSVDTSAAKQVPLSTIFSEIKSFFKL